MTVLQQEKINSSGLKMSERYITPEYLAHLPTSPESKNEKSPLQMLAQTCSQIGVDNGPSKILTTTEKLKSGEEKVKKNDSAEQDVRHDKVSFKPYVNNGNGRSESTSERSGNNSSSPKSSSSSPVLLSSSYSDYKTKDNKSNSEPGRQAGVQKASSTPSPIIQSGMDLMSKQKLPSVPTTTSLYDPSNPAFRPTGLEGYPSSLSGHAAICKDPACRDPTCPTANYNAYLARLTLSSASGLPPGYMELLESYKMYSAAASGMRMPGLPPSLTPQESQLAAYSQLLGAGGGGAASLRGPYPSALSSLATSRYSPYPKPGYPPSHLPPSISGVGSVGVPPLPQLPPHLSSLGAMTASNQMALYSLLGGRL